MKRVQGFSGSELDVYGDIQVNTSAINGRQDMGCCELTLNKAGQKKRAH